MRCDGFRSPERHHKENSSSPFTDTSSHPMKAKREIRSEMKSFPLHVKANKAEEVCAEGDAPDDDLCFGEITRSAPRTQRQMITARAAQTKVTRNSESNFSHLLPCFSICCVTIYIVSETKWNTKSLSRQVFFNDSFSLMMEDLSDEIFMNMGDKWICRTSELRPTRFRNLRCRIFMMNMRADTLRSWDC